MAGGRVAKGVYAIQPNGGFKRTCRTPAVKSIQDVGDAADNSKDQYAISQWRQLVILTQRTFKATIRDPAVVYVRTLAAMGIALLIGIIFFQVN